MAGGTDELAGREGLAHVVRADHVGDVVARAESYCEGDAADDGYGSAGGENGEEGDLDADLVGTDQDGADQNQQLRDPRQGEALRMRKPRRGCQEQIGDETGNDVASADDEHARDQRRQVVDQARQPVGERL
jgi:hypothetical protein